jgi:hypothetical protein
MKVKTVYVITVYTYVLPFSQTDLDNKSLP